MDILLLFFICLGASIIQGTTGFGYAIIVMPVLSLFIPFKICAATIAISGFFLAAQVSFKLRKHINFKLLIPVLVTTIIGRSIGGYGLIYFEIEILKIILGVVLIILSIYFAFYKNKFALAPSTKNGMSMGLISGILGGAFNMSGPPLVLYYYSAIKEKLQYNATIQATFALGAIYTVSLHFLSGNVNMEVAQFSAASMAAVSIGSIIGLRIFKRLHRETLSKFIYSFMSAMGILLMFK